mmetsp:Transcript_42812/g.79808  ORF Transcript_42812/g.79808 Transcript_42812/m.79808 type:complete len:229 (-) Transcript_42812:342-1028(-)
MPRRGWTKVCEGASDSFGSLLCQMLPHAFVVALPLHQLFANMSLLQVQRHASHLARKLAHEDLYAIVIDVFVPGKVECQILQIAWEPRGQSGDVFVVELSLPEVQLQLLQARRQASSQHLQLLGANLHESHVELQGLLTKASVQRLHQLSLHSVHVTVANIATHDPTPERQGEERLQSRRDEAVGLVLLDSLFVQVAVCEEIQDLLLVLLVGDLRPLHGDSQGCLHDL